MESGNVGGGEDGESGVKKGGGVNWAIKVV